MAFWPFYIHATELTGKGAPLTAGVKQSGCLAMRAGKSVLKTQGILWGASQYRHDQGRANGGLEHIQCRQNHYKLAFSGIKVWTSPLGTRTS